MNERLKQPNDVGVLPTSRQVSAASSDRKRLFRTSQIQSDDPSWLRRNTISPPGTAFCTHDCPPSAVRRTNPAGPTMMPTRSFSHLNAWMLAVPPGSIGNGACDEGIARQ